MRKESTVNPYEYRSIKWALMEEDWSDLTITQISEVFEGVGPKDVQRHIAAIKAKTGYAVPHKKGRAGRKKKA